MSKYKIEGRKQRGGMTKRNYNRENQQGQEFVENMNKTGNKEGAQILK